MDLLTSTKRPAANTVEWVYEERTLFFGRDGPETADPLVGDPLSLPLRPSRNRKMRGAAALLAGAGILGALAYFVAEHSGHGPVQATYKIPSPVQSAAVVKALPPPNLLKPVSPEEATKENADRPFVVRPDTAAAKFVLHTDGDDRTRALNCLAQAVYYEAAGEGVDGGRAVAQVVLNRLHHPGFPSTVCGVVYQGSDRPTGCQFSFTCDGSMERIPVPWLWTRSKQIADEALKGHVFAAVGHATHYHADYVLPYWADSLDKSIQIGRHIFYRLRSSLGDARGFSQRYGGIEPPFRVPGAAIVMPSTAETQKLATALLGDSVEGSTKAIVERAAPTPSSPLKVDSGHGTLLADAGIATPQEPKRKKATQCVASSDREQISALRADDLRASAAASTC